MGILDSFKKAVSDKVEDIDKTYNPVRKATEIFEAGTKPPSQQIPPGQGPEPEVKKVDESIIKKPF